MEERGGGIHKGIRGGWYVAGGLGAMTAFKCCSDCEMENSAANHLSVSECGAPGLNKQPAGWMGL